MHICSANDVYNYKLEAEAFGTSVSKSIEAKTYIVLPPLAHVDRFLEVRISNERPETHLINSISLFVADAPDESNVLPDIGNKLFQVDTTMIR